MKSKTLGFVRVAGFVFALVIVGLVVVKPALAQVGSSTDTVVEETIPPEPTSPTTESTTTETEAASTAPIEQVEAISGDTAVMEATNTAPAVAPEEEVVIVADGLFKGVEVKDTPPDGFTEVYIIGMRYTDYFTDGTTIYEFPGDPEIHAHIAEKNAPIPTHEGLTWVKSHGNYLYDTPSGDLEEGQYAVQRSGTIIAKYPPFISSTSTAPIAPPTAPPTAPTPSSTTEPAPEVSATSSESTGETAPSAQDTSSSTPPAVDAPEPDTGVTASTESAEPSTSTP